MAIGVVAGASGCGNGTALHGRYDRRCDKAWTVGEFFIRKGKCWQRFRERFEEVAWTEAEIRQSLRRAGFDAIQAWDDTPFATPESKISPGFRTIYLARKAR